MKKIFLMLTALLFILPNMTIAYRKGKFNQRPNNRAPQKMINIVVEKLKLNTTQKNKFIEFHDACMKLRSPRRDRNRDKGRQLFQEIALQVRKDKIDQKSLEQKIPTKAEVEKEYTEMKALHHDMINKLIAFHQTLTKKQKEAFANFSDDFLQNKRPRFRRSQEYGRRSNMRRSKDRKSNMRRHNGRKSNMRMNQRGRN